MSEYCEWDYVFTADTWMERPTARHYAQTENVN